MNQLVTKIGLEIHVQLKTKSKMFCSCDNNAEGKAPNSVVCPVCLGLPGALPVANKQAIEWTVKTGLALNCEIPKTAKFDRKHYFYPDLPKGYQISQYDEPFCVGGYVEIDGQKVNLTRIHLEEDAGKLIHRNGQSLVDLNRAGTPLMEIVTEPEITSPEMAGDFLRKLQKIVRDVVQVSEASMEKGHLRCDANISVSEMQPLTIDHRPPTALRMSPIIEIKNLNSFKFVEKALALVEEKLKAEHGQWPEKNSKETWGYDSVNNKVYLQRRKEEAADYRYFPEPDLPPVNMTKFDLESLKSSISNSLEENVEGLKSIGIAEAEAKVLLNDRAKNEFFERLSLDLPDSQKVLAAKAIIHNYFPFKTDETDLEKIKDYREAIADLSTGKIQKNNFSIITVSIHNGMTYEDAAREFLGGAAIDLDGKVEEIILANQAELSRYKAGEKQLLGFFMGAVMKETKNSANPQEVSRILREKLENR